jgi:hypothetical protein
MRYSLLLFSSSFLHAYEGIWGSWSLWSLEVIGNGLVFGRSWIFTIPDNRRVRGNRNPIFNCFRDGLRINRNATAAPRLRSRYFWNLCADDQGAVERIIEATNKSLVSRRFGRRLAQAEDRFESAMRRTRWK